MRRGLGTDIGYVNIVGPGEGVVRQRFGILYFGRGGSVRGVWGQTLRRGGFEDKYGGCSYYVGWRSFGTDIGDVNIVVELGAWGREDWEC